MDPDPYALLGDVETATDGLIAAAAGLDDPGVRAATALPGWTRGHVLTHVSRSADSMTNLLDWARTGVETPQYASREARDAGIAEGAPRGAAAQLADLRETARRFARTARGLPPAAWTADVRSFNGDTHTAWFTLVRRWCEVELHHVDLGTGYTPADWPAAFTAHVLDYTAQRWTFRADAPVSALRDTTTGREWTFTSGGPAVAGPGNALAAWVTGRSPADPPGAGLTAAPGDLPVPPAWP